MTLQQKVVTGDFTAKGSICLLHIKRQYLLTLQQKAVTDDFTAKGSSCFIYSKMQYLLTLQQKAVSAHFLSNQVLPFAFAERNRCHPSRHEIFAQCCFNVVPASKTVEQH